MVSYTAIVIVGAFLSMIFLEASKKLDPILGNGYGRFLVFCLCIAFLSEIGILTAPASIRGIFNMLFSFSVIGVFGSVILMGIGFFLYVLALYHARKL